MEADQQHPNSNDGSTPTPQVESVTPEELHKERKPSRNPLKWFQNSGPGASASTASNSSRSSSKSTTSSSNSKAKPPLVVHYFPTAGRPGLA